METFAPHPSLTLRTAVWCFPVGYRTALSRCPIAYGEAPRKDQVLLGNQFILKPWV
eukprot:gene26201-biopygen14868